MKDLDAIDEINKRIESLESVASKKLEELNVIKAELPKREAELFSIRGGIAELKRLLQLENVLKNAEVVERADNNKHKPSSNEKQPK